MGNESFFVNNYTAKENECILGLTGPPLGDIVEIPIGTDGGYIILRHLVDGEKMVLDNHHLVALSANSRYKVTSLVD